MGQFSKKMSDRERHMSQTLQAAHQKINAMESAMKRMAEELKIEREKLLLTLYSTIAERDEAVSKLSAIENPVQAVALEVAQENRQEASVPGVAPAEMATNA